MSRPHKEKNIIKVTRGVSCLDRKGAIDQEARTSVNLYAPNNKVSKCIKKKPKAKLFPQKLLLKQTEPPTGVVDDAPQMPPTPSLSWHPHTPHATLLCANL